MFYARRCWRLSLVSVFVFWVKWMYLRDISVLTSFCYAGQHWVRPWGQRRQEKDHVSSTRFNSWKRLCSSEMVCLSGSTKSDREGRSSDQEDLGRVNEHRLGACGFGAWGRGRGEQRTRGACECVPGPTSRMAVPGPRRAGERLEVLWNQVRNAKC